MSNHYSARDVFDRGSLSRICEMHEYDFARSFDLDIYEVPQQKSPDDFYLYRDNGSSVLAVAHLDTVAPFYQRDCHFLRTEAGLVVYSRALDDRLGAYIVLDMLPQMDINFDVLLTVGEEMGMSTAEYFVPTKQYDWMIEFDRGGTDVVMYQYDDAEVRDMVKQSGARVGDGIFSDICYLEHLGVKGFNWGVGYQDYHSPRAHAYLDDTLDMVDRFTLFHELNKGVYMPHYPDRRRGRRGAWWMYGEAEDGIVDGILIPSDDDDFDLDDGEPKASIEDVDLPDYSDPFFWEDSYSQRLG